MEIEKDIMIPDMPDPKVANEESCADLPSESHTEHVNDDENVSNDNRIEADNGDDFLKLDEVKSESISGLDNIQQQIINDEKVSNDEVIEDGGNNLVKAAEEKIEENICDADKMVMHANDNGKESADIDLEADNSKDFVNIPEEKSENICNKKEGNCDAETNAAGVNCVDISCGQDATTPDKKENVQKLEPKSDERRQVSEALPEKHSTNKNDTADVPTLKILDLTNSNVIDLETSGCFYDDDIDVIILEQHEHYVTAGEIDEIGDCSKCNILAGRKDSEAKEDKERRDSEQNKTKSGPSATENVGHGDSDDDADDVIDSDEEEEDRNKVPLKEPSNQGSAKDIKSQAEEEDSEAKKDDDNDRRNPQYIPKKGSFYQHDDRTTAEQDVEYEETVEAKREPPVEKKKVWRDSSGGRWSHDKYVEEEQAPKSSQEIIKTYGYNIREENVPPRGKRRKKYSRGPSTYTRSWEDERAYARPNPVPARHSRRDDTEEFPPLNSNTPRSRVGETSSARTRASFRPQNTSSRNQRSSLQNERGSYQNERSSYQNERGSYQNERGSYQNDRASHQNDRASHQNDRPSHQNDRPSHQNDRPSHQNDRPSHQNDRPSHQNDRPSYQNDRPSHQNDRPSYQNDRPSHQNNRPSHQNDRASYQNDRAFYQNEQSSTETKRSSVQKERTSGRFEKGPSKPYQNDYVSNNKKYPDQSSKSGSVPQKYNDKQRPPPETHSAHTSKVYSNNSKPSGSFEKESRTVFSSTSSREYRVEEDAPFPHEYRDQSRNVFTNRSRTSRGDSHAAYRPFTQAGRDSAVAPKSEKSNKYKDNKSVTEEASTHSPPQHDKKKVGSAAPYYSASTHNAEIPASTGVYKSRGVMPFSKPVGRSNAAPNYEGGRVFEFVKGRGRSRGLTVEIMDETFEFPPSSNAQFLPPLNNPETVDDDNLVTDFENMALDCPQFEDADGSNSSSKKSTGQNFNSERRQAVVPPRLQESAAVRPKRYSSLRQRPILDSNIQQEYQNYYQQSYIPQQMYQNQVFQDNVQTTNSPPIQLLSHVTHVTVPGTAYQGSYTPGTYVQQAPNIIQNPSGVMQQASVMQQGSTVMQSSQNVIQQGPVLQTPQSFLQSPPPTILQQNAPVIQQNPATNLLPSQTYISQTPQVVNYLPSSAQGQFQNLETQGFQTFQGYSPVNDWSDNSTCAPSSVASDIYPAQAGITYYSPEEQSAPRVTQKRQRTAIPIVPPSENIPSAVDSGNQEGTPETETAEDKNGQLDGGPSANSPGQDAP